MGDPAGIGPEICLRALADTSLHEICVPIVFGDAAILRRVAAICHLPPPASLVTDPADLDRVSSPAVYNLQCLAAKDVTAGAVSASTGAASYRYVVAAIEAATNGRVDAVCTGPIHKEALHDAGVGYPGHTEIFASRTDAGHTCMMLTTKEITCSLVTAHLGYADVAEALSTERIVKVIELTADAMRRIRGEDPRIVVCGLNPHAGEHGLFGTGEEETLIRPAVDMARAKGLSVEGPLPPDTAFLPARRKKTDAYVCMYHDQGLIPLKTLAFDTAVNVTLGLPIVRTSVGHGTALDIAWQGEADAGSLCDAIRLAARLSGKSCVGM
ncbi:MAG: 4-hydroxythreonine-4-phosphate dehydrogenase PdxA [Lentisphaerae bacterium]|nr:4-hydroxythreonine-4-phosphate dehydrogenase PdxA [Lentisphaerota bacterium]